MAKKRVQVGQFQKRAQLQSVARVVDQYVAPPKTNRQAQIASALEQAIPALQKYQEAQLEKDLNEVESKVIEAVNSGNMKDLLTDYEGFSDTHNLVRNTHAKQRYEKTLAPLAARQVGSELARRYQESDYAQSTNPNDYQKFLNENLDDILSPYSGSFSESTGGVAEFQRSINPYINQFQQRFTESAIANDKREEKEALQVSLVNVSNPQEAREWVKTAKNTGILTNYEIDELIFNQMQSEVEGASGTYSNKTFKSFETLNVGKTGQKYGTKFTTGGGFNGKSIVEYSDEDIKIKQLTYDAKKRTEENQLQATISNQIILENHVDLVEAYTPTDTPEQSAIKIQEVKEKIRSKLIEQNISPAIIEITLADMDTKYDAKASEQETNSSARYDYIEAYNNIINNKDITDPKAALESYLQNMQPKMTLAGFQMLEKTFTDIAESRGLNRAKPVMDAIMRRIKEIRGYSTSSEVADSLYIQEQINNIQNIVLGAGDALPTDEEGIFNYIMNERGDLVPTKYNNDRQAVTFEKIGNYGDVSVLYTNEPKSLSAQKPRGFTREVMGGN